VVVIGAGVLGLACAYELSADPTVEVTVVDRNHPGAGSTGLSVGVFTRQYLALEEIDIRVRGVAALCDLEARGLNMRRIGLLRPARDAGTLEGFAASVAAQQELGVADARLLDRDAVAALVPAFDAADVTGGLWCPSDGYLDGAELCTLLAEGAQERGARIAGRTRVTGLRRGARHTLLTDRGELRADVVVNASGAWASHVGDLLEAPVDVVNERHEAYLFELPRDADRATIPMVLDYVPGGAEGLYFRQEGEGQLIAGLHSNEPLGEPVGDPDRYFRGATDAGAEVVIEQLAAALPGIEDIGYRGGWAGLYPHSPDGGLVAGPHPDDPAVLVGGGLGGNGLSVALPLGRVLADWVRFGEPRSLPGAERFVPRPVAVTVNDGAEEAT
jgi:sarcosine oxidase subunit beta